jgi:5-methylthioribose kinase
MKYYSLDKEKVIEYVEQAEIFAQDGQLIAEEIGDGNLNLVFRIRENGHSVILKQALPYLRVAGESWPLTLDRVRIEADAIEVQEQYVSGLVPKILHRNNDMALMVMEDLHPLEVMRGGTIRMKTYPEFAEHISTFMANMFFYTSELYMTSLEKKALVKKFLNPELCDITEKLIFTDPYYDAESNIINPALKPYLEKVFWKKDALRLEASKMKYKFLTEAQSLLHGDFHTGSIFASEEKTIVFDTEFAFVGPSAFDMGLLMGNILINYVSWSGKDYPAETIKDYRRYTLETIGDISTMFEAKFIQNWENDCSDVTGNVSGYRQFYMRNLFVDMIGFASTVMVRRMHGLAHNVDVDEIEDLDVRKDVQILILELAEELMMSRVKFADIGEVTGLVKDKIF